VERRGVRPTEIICVRFNLQINPVLSVFLWFTVNYLPVLIPVGTRFSARPDRPWGPPSLLQNGYHVFPWVKVRPRRAADHSPPSSAAAVEE